MSLMIISLIQYFEFQVKLLGPFALDQNGSEVLHIAVEKITKVFVCPHRIVLSKLCLMLLSHRDKGYESVFEDRNLGPSHQI